MPGRRPKRRRMQQRVAEEVDDILNVVDDYLSGSDACENLTRKSSTLLQKPRPSNEKRSKARTTSKSQIVSPKRRSKLRVNMETPNTTTKKRRRRNLTGEWLGVLDNQPSNKKRPERKASKKTSKKNGYEAKKRVQDMSTRDLVSRIHDHFDGDEDGFLNEEELAKLKCNTCPTDDNLGYRYTCGLVEADVDKGISVDQLLELYDLCSGGRNTVKDDYIKIFLGEDDGGDVKVDTEPSSQKRLRRSQRARQQTMKNSSRAPKTQGNSEITVRENPETQKEIKQRKKGDKEKLRTNAKISKTGKTIAKNQKDEVANTLTTNASKTKKHQTKEEQTITKRHSLDPMKEENSTLREGVAQVELEDSLDASDLLDIIVPSQHDDAAEIEEEEAETLHRNNPDDVDTDDFAATVSLPLPQPTQDEVEDTEEPQSLTKEVDDKRKDDMGAVSSIINRNAPCKSISSPTSSNENKTEVVATKIPSEKGETTAPTARMQASIIPTSATTASTTASSCSSPATADRAGKRDKASAPKFGERTRRSSTEETEEIGLRREEQHVVGEHDKSETVDIPPTLVLQPSLEDMVDSGEKKKKKSKETKQSSKTPATITAEVNAAVEVSGVSSSLTNSQEEMQDLQSVFMELDQSESQKKEFLWGLNDKKITLKRIHEAEVKNIRNRIRSKSENMRRIKKDIANLTAQLEGLTKDISRSEKDLIMKEDLFKRKKEALLTQKQDALSSLAEIANKKRAVLDNLMRE